MWLSFVGIAASTPGISLTWLCQLVGMHFFHASQTQLCYQSFPCGLEVRSREEDAGLRVGVRCSGCAALSGMGAPSASPAPLLSTLGCAASLLNVTTVAER